MKQAIEHYERATTLDPEYALAWSAPAFANTATALNSDFAPLEVRPRVQNLVRRAIGANADLSEAQYALGYQNFILEWDWPTAETALRRAIDLDSRNMWAHLTLGHLLSQMGRHNEALAAMRRARELEPQEVMTHALSSQVAFQARDFQAALDHASQAVALDHGFWIGHIRRAHALDQKAGELDAVLDAIALADRFSGGNSKAPSLTGYALAKAGRRDEARKVLAALEALSRQRYVPPYALALVHAGLGETDAVFEWLDRAFDAHDAHLIYLPVDVKWDPYRNDPRFEALLTRCGFSGSTASDRSREARSLPRPGRPESRSDRPPLWPIDDEFANLEACDCKLVERQAAHAAAAECERANGQPADREGAYRVRTNCHRAGGHRTKRHAAGKRSPRPNRRNFVDVRIDVGCQFGGRLQVRRRCGVAQHCLEIRAASPLGVVGHPHAIDASVNVGRDESGHTANRLIGRPSQQRDESILFGWVDGEHIDDGDNVSACTDVGHGRFPPTHALQRSASSRAEVASCGPGAA